MAMKKDKKQKPKTKGRKKQPKLPLFDSGNPKLAEEIKQAPMTIAARREIRLQLMNELLNDARQNSGVLSADTLSDMIAVEVRDNELEDLS